MSNDEFTKLFKYMEKHFDVIEVRIDDTSTKKSVNQLQNTMDRYAIHLDTYMTEMAAMQHKIDRLERMIDYLADKAGVSKRILETL